MTTDDAVKLAMWLHRTYDTLIRVDPIHAGAAFGLTPLVWLRQYADGYEPTGAAVLYVDTYMQEFTR
jgi:hypothetical protein